MQVKLVSKTEVCLSLNDFDETRRDLPVLTSDNLIAYCARVSSPQNQNKVETAPRLIRYLIDHKHWSPFEMASMCVEITTSRAIAQQILRHRSFSFQEFSQRYATATEFEPIELRRQGATNRQGGEEVFDPFLPAFDCNASTAIHDYLDYGARLYAALLEAETAKECARFILPLTTQTRLYMHGTVRSWIHYLEQRLDPHAQKEHRLLAEKIKQIFCEVYPDTAAALNNFLPDGEVL